MVGLSFDWNGRASSSINQYCSEITRVNYPFSVIVRQSSIVLLLVFILSGVEFPVVGRILSLAWSGKLPGGRVIFQMVGLAFQVVAPAFDWNGQVSIWHGQVSFSTIRSVFRAIRQA